MSLVSAYNEWDPLEEVIVGRAENAQIAKADYGLFAVEYRDCGSPDKIPSGRYPDRVIEETKEDLDKLVKFFEDSGVVVRRPDIFDHSKVFSTPDWSSDGQFNYCPRDLFIVVGETVIEAPMTLRPRQFETISFKPILMDYLESGARWIAAPKPRLLDNTYRLKPNTLAITDDEPIFDAANILRMGEDIVYLVSDSGNKKGARWLQTALGSEYRVHAYENVYTGTHIDTTISVVRPGLVVVSAERVNPSNLPDVFKKWDVIYLSEVVDIGFTNVPYASEWIGINFLMLNPSTAIVDGTQAPLIRELEKRDINVVPLTMRHARTMGGGLHCVTLDVRRKGTKQRYI